MDITAAELRALTLTNQDQTEKTVILMKTVCKRFAGKGKSSVKFTIFSKDLTTAWPANHEECIIKAIADNLTEFTTIKVDRINGLLTWTRVDLEKLKTLFGEGFTVDINDHKEITISW